MSDTNLVVSGRRLADKFAALEAAPEGRTDEAKKSDLAAFVGAKPSDLAAGGRTEAAPGLESAAMPELSDLERASMLMRFDAAVQLLKEADLHPGVFSTTENQIAAVIQSALAERAAVDPTKLSPAGDTREAKFDERDVRWALSLITWIGKLSPHEFKPLPTQIETFTKELKLAIMGDWGTSLYGAPKCAASISASGGFDYVVHLGDVYYSGTMAEVKSNFLKGWPTVPGARYRACNGNHEMYSGGYGYFDELLPAFNQASSCFAIQNEDWLIVGLDSAYADHDLYADDRDRSKNQIVWLKDMVDASVGKKLVLFTHHQPFSHFDGPGDKIVDKLLPLLNGKRITAWYWGHEHRCVVYDRHPKWGFHGRCIGHGGYPYFRGLSLAFNEIVAPRMKSYGFWRELPENAQTGTPRAILLDGPNPDVEGHEDEYGPNGYVSLEFNGPTLTERYFLPEGTELFNKDIS